MTQKEMVLRHLNDGYRISSFVSFREYGIVDLQAIIFTLRRQGLNIVDEWKSTTNRYGEFVKYKEYWLEESK